MRKSPINRLGDVDGYRSRAGMTSTHAKARGVNTQSSRNSSSVRPACFNGRMYAFLARLVMGWQFIMLLRERSVDNPAATRPQGLT